MLKYFYLLQVLILCAFLGSGAIAQSSVQLPGGVQLYDSNNDVPYLIKNNENIDNTIKSNIFVKVSVNKTTCFVGEPILVVYKLLTRLQSESKLTKQPEFSGCSVIEMTTDELLPHKEIIDGKPYKSYIIRKVQLVPLQEGNITLGTAEVENNISFFKTISEAYNGTPSLIKKATLSNTLLSVTVKPLPTEKKPAHFNNTVGKFTILAKVSKLTDTANDNNNLEITITGKGNFQNLVCPTINWPTDIEHFESETAETIDKLSFPVSGKKVFTIPFSCKKEGNLTILPIAFSFFDTESKQYKTVITDSIKINVLPAAEKIDMSKMSAEVGNAKYIWIVPFIAVIVGLILWLTFFKEKKKKIVANIDAVEEPSVPLIVAKTNEERLSDLLLIEDNKDYYLEAKRLATELFEKEDDAIKKAELEKLINNCNITLYAYGNNITKEAVFTKLTELI